MTDSLIHPQGAELPTVTIVALCHNHASFLREALDSILNQTYSPLEVWLVGDVVEVGVYDVRHPRSKVDDEKDE